MTATLCTAQAFTRCEVYQYAGRDSKHKVIALWQTFNAAGKLSKEVYNNFHYNAAESNQDGSYMYFYKDTLLVKQTFVDKDKDGTKLLCYYNGKNQLIKQEFFTFEKRLKKEVDKGLGRPGGCIITADDYEKKPSWKQTSEIKYAYDKDGHVTLYDATKLHYSAQNRFTWTYDPQGRLLQYCSYEGQRLIWVEAYTYFQGGYARSRTWYDSDGRAKHLKAGSTDYYPQYTSTFYLDKKGRVVKEVTATEKQEQIGTQTTAYHPNGQIARTVYLDKNGMPEMTHIYVYH